MRKMLSQVLYFVSYIESTIIHFYYMKCAQALDNIYSQVLNKYTFLAGLYNIRRVLTLATRIKVMV